MLSLTTCQAAIAEPFCAALARYVNDRLGPATFVGDVSWQQRQKMLKAGEIDLGWVCGLTYARWSAEPGPPVQLLAAPVQLGSRYANRPVYFSDVVVRADSPFTSFASLRGARWAYNEPGSHSGYNVTLWALARLGARHNFFGSAIQSGAHQRSLEMILDGTIDASAIDSTVLELVLIANPALASQIRLIEALGPSPIPPWVASRHLAPDRLSALRDLYCNLHLDPQGKAILSAGHIERFTAVSDADYGPIREMAREAAEVRW